MKHHEQLLKEMNSGWTGTIRQELLGPAPAGPEELARESLGALRYLGPGPWYGFISGKQKGAPHERKDSNRL